MTDSTNIPIDLLSMLLDEKDVTLSHRDDDDASALLQALEQETTGAEFIYAQALEQENAGAGFTYAQNMSLFGDINDVPDLDSLLESDDDSLRGLDLFEQYLQQLANGSPAVPVAGHKRKFDDSDILADATTLEMFNSMTVVTPQIEDLGAPFAKRPFVDDSELSLSFLENPLGDIGDMNMEDFQYEGSDTILV